MENNGNGKRHFQQDGKVHFQLKTLKVTNGDIVVVRVPRDDIPGRIRENILVQLRQSFPKNELLMVGSKMDLSVLPKKTLYAMGWIKKDEVAQTEQQDIKVGIKDFEKYTQRVELMNFMKGKAEEFARQIKAELEKGLGVKIEAKVGIFVKSVE